MTVSTSGATSFPNNPCFNVSKNADQTVADNTVTKLTFSEITDGDHSGRVINQGGLFASDRFTVTSTTVGIYAFHTNLLFEASADIADSYLIWQKNGANWTLNYPNAGYANSNRNGSFNASTIINLDTAGDYVEIHYFGDIGSSGTTLFNWGNNTTNQRVSWCGFKIA